METLTYTGKLVVTSCWCGIKLALPNALYQKMQSDSKQAAFCPVGHEFVFSKNAATREKERADRLASDLRIARASRDAARDQAAAAHRSAIAFKGHITRLRNKISNGVCPVSGCRRHFDNVQAHIEGQHPQWAAEHPEVLG